MLDSVAFRMRGVLGALGKVDGSGLRCNSADEPSTTLREADQELSPLSDVAEQVYNPESSRRKSKQQQQPSVST
jgi:hypothetical protein